MHICGQLCNILEFSSHCDFFNLPLGKSFRVPFHCMYQHWVHIISGIIISRYSTHYHLDTTVVYASWSWFEYSHRPAIIPHNKVIIDLAIKLDMLVTCYPIQLHDVDCSTFMIPYRSIPINITHRILSCFYGVEIYVLGLIYCYDMIEKIWIAK